MGKDTMNEIVMKCIKCEEYTTIERDSDGLCETCKPKKEFSKPSPALKKSFTSIMNEINKIDHQFYCRCETCTNLSEDPELNIPRAQWHGQSMAEVEQIKSFHETENEGHSCGVGQY
jgi:hypothetical protein